MRIPGWMPAVAFNALLLIIPLLAAHIVVNAFARQAITDVPTVEALDQTRRGIDNAFTEMKSRTGDPREYWASLIDNQLIAQDLSAARGLMLAAPQMLDTNDVKAVQAAADSQVDGTADERLVNAALLFLRDDVRARYEEQLQPERIDMDAVSATVAAEAGEARGIVGVSTATLNDTPITGAGSDEDLLPDSGTTETAASTSFALLGDLEDLAANAKRWINEDQYDPFILRLTGISMATEATNPAEARNISQAASILKSAYRARRLTDQYSRTLTLRAEAAAPEKVLRPALEEALAGLVPMSVRGKRVEQAFSNSIDPDGLVRLMSEVDQINRITDMTSPATTLSLLEYVETPEDLRRARLLTEAGGDRAAALVKLRGDDALGTANTGIELSWSTSLQVMGFAASTMVLLWLALSALMKSLRRPRRPSLDFGT